MNLFGDDMALSVLPYDGTAIYYGKVLSATKSLEYLNALLLTLPWKNDEAFIYGKHHLTARKIALQGDKAFNYAYSGTSRKADVWSKEVYEIKLLVEKILNQSYNSCLLNLYHNGNEGMAWHSDDEKELGKNATIAILSLGAERKFSFKHKQNGKLISLVLEQGSLLVMKNETQEHWLHSVPKTTRINKPRVSLTFRNLKFV